MISDITIFQKIKYHEKESVPFSNLHRSPTWANGSLRSPCFQTCSSSHSCTAVIVIFQMQTVSWFSFSGVKISPLSAPTYVVLWTSCFNHPEFVKVLPGHHCTPLHMQFFQHIRAIHPFPTPFYSSFQTTPSVPSPWSLFSLLPHFLLCLQPNSVSANHTIIQSFTLIDLIPHQKLFAFI